MSLESLIGTSPTWGLALDAQGGGMVGPLSAFAAARPGFTITLIQPSDVPNGVPTERLHVRENAQEFDVIYHNFDGYRGLWHERGRNWLLWTEDLKHVFMSQGPEDSARRWVYVRFILRHFIIRHLVALPGYCRMHAVAGPCHGAASDSGLIIAGPYLSGKTYLIERLVERGLISELVEDDCAVVDADWQLHCLIPAEREARHMRRLPIRAMVCLDPEAQGIEPIESGAAAAWALGIQASWPLSWIPGIAFPQTSVEYAPPFATSLRMPKHPALEEAVGAIRPLVKAVAAS